MSFKILSVFTWLKNLIQLDIRKTKAKGYESARNFKKTIKKVVLISQRIEGYKPASKPLQQQAKEIMAKYHVKISA